MPAKFHEELFGVNRKMMRGGQETDPHKAVKNKERLYGRGGILEIK